MKGFYNQLLLIDVTTESYETRELPDPLFETYLGGKGLASYLLAQFNPKGIDPFDPQNCLIFATGPLTGSTVWGSCRYGLFTKSPQTGLYSESYAGGRVPEAIDAVGVDAIVITGKSERLKVLVISPEDVCFHDATDIHGQDTFATQDRVMARYAVGRGPMKEGAVVIGPAGENRVRFSVVENDYWRSAGRTGTGAVMGAKGIKAILFMGDRKRTVHDSRRVRAFAKDLAEEAKDNPAVQDYKAVGTPGMVAVINTVGAFPTQYWSKGTCAHWEQISAEALHERCLVKPHACLKCFMACGRLSTVKHGRPAGLKVEGPEYETIFAFGGLCGVAHIEDIAFLNDKCDRLGLDTISTGNLCAFTIEAAKRNIIGYPIEYGHIDSISQLIDDIAFRKGIGDILARGIRHAAAVWGLADLAVHVKGLEPAGYDPRVLKGVGLGYAVSDRGACHLRATFYKAEISGMIDPGTIQGKARLFIDFEDRLTLFDSLILCRFYRDLYPWDGLGEIIQAVTGLEVNKDFLVKTAANISNLVRRFNIREGLTPSHDRLPSRFHKRPLESGHIITEQELSTMISDYYRLRGWDEHGRPGS